MIKKHTLEETPTPCPKCGTTDCISHKEYQSHITINGAGVVSVSSEAIFQSCRARQQIKYLSENIKKFIR